MNAPRFISSQSQIQNATRLHEAIQEELKRLVEGGITQEELDQAKEGYLQSQSARSRRRH